MPQRMVTSHLHQSTSCITYQVITSSSGATPYTSPTGTRLPLENIFSPSVVSSSSYMAGPLILQLTNLLDYIGYSSSTVDILTSKLITQRNLEHSPLHSSLSDLVRPHTASSEGPRLKSISHHWQHALVVQSRFHVLKYTLLTGDYQSWV
ncbi:unnamed protein product [Parnassius mnemosyne]|uniref:Uncharacterized protein n=1 Tax=Parnassius mnemosyne TaxID=213953 RepID=A0AAV1M7Q1_9NEOP